MSDPEDDQGSPSLAASRSRRGPSKKLGARASALERLKAAKNKDYKYEVDTEIDNVYELVDEKEYAEKVQQRLEEDFIVDDDGEYADDGREIFEDEDQQGGKKKGGKGEKRKRGEDLFWITHIVHNF